MKKRERKDPWEQEETVLRTMVGIFCDAHHGKGFLCRECEELLGYGVSRLKACPFGAQKGDCARCAIHCYGPTMREKIRIVMGYSGPRMLWRHPGMTLRHTFRRARNLGRPKRVREKKGQYPFKEE